jgi:hypothetical protein
MTIHEQFMVTHTKVIRQLLQMQQQLAQQLQNNPRGENLDGLPRVTKYEHFYAMEPPDFRGGQRTTGCICVDQGH